ncbi:probable LRR receptor-like serine/threonine-protein kinase At1g29720 [Hevea brasiliensis]|uniref:probable LRR receptor-like serine/threonine-protein kinase At1g29720 n=1 Tax=Hevea brasiliensis TaxID=3981 RepID=UPI0025F2A597|nr:probable LRR receptor-like serine/threonine-protein kinase At1g29720 [Hevea brasiliensis]
MAPEYALWGYLTYKADVYSFGVVALEIVSGKHDLSYEPEENFICLLDWACHLPQNGNLAELVDENLGSEFEKEEAEKMIKVALLCTNASHSLRPTMSEVVNMLEGTSIIPDVIPEESSYYEDMRFKTIKDHKQMRSQRVEGSEDHNSTSNWGSSTSANDLYEIKEESYKRFKAWRDHYKQIEIPSEVSTSAPSKTASSLASVHDITKNSG